CKERQSGSPEPQNQEIKDWFASYLCAEAAGPRGPRKQRSVMQSRSWIPHSATPIVATKPPAIIETWSVKIHPTSMPSSAAVIRAEALDQINRDVVHRPSGRSSIQRPLENRQRLIPDRHPKATNLNGIIRAGSTARSRS